MGEREDIAAIRGALERIATALERLTAPVEKQAPKREARRLSDEEVRARVQRKLARAGAVSR